MWIFSFSEKGFLFTKRMYIFMHIFILRRQKKKHTPSTFRKKPSFPLAKSATFLYNKSKNDVAGHKARERDEI